MRGGGDLDICWRIQEQKLGTIATDTRVLMEWEPRTSLRDLASQWKRYGHSNAYIRWVSRQDGAGREQDESTRHSLAEGWVTVRAELQRPLIELAANAIVGLAFQYGYFSAQLKRAQFEMPVHFEVAASPDSA
jgi:hypothetical protein